MAEDLAPIIVVFAFGFGFAFGPGDALRFGPGDGLLFGFAFAFAVRAGAEPPELQAEHIITPAEVSNRDDFSILQSHCEHFRHSIWNVPKEHFIMPPSIALPQATHFCPNSSAKQGLQNNEPFCTL
jgi:hypothetical protein